MFPYIALLTATSVATLGGLNRRSKFLLLLALVYVIAIGFRFHIGVDWNNYIYNYNAASQMDIVEIILLPEPGFGLLYLLAREVGGGIILINVLSAIVFCLGLFSFIRRCNEPFLALSIASPYLVFVIAMSATSQAMALGVIFYLFATWEKRKTWVRVAFVLLASMFHFSSLFMLVFVAYGSMLSFFTRIAVAFGVVLVMIGVIAFAPSRVEFYVDTYVGSGGGAITAEGALPHVLLVSFPAAAYLFFRGLWVERIGRSSLLDSLSIAAVALLPIIWVSSLGADRMSLYFWPVTMYVVSGWTALIDSGTGRIAYRLVVIFASFALLVGWLTLANSAYAFLPYKNYLLVPEWASLWRR